MIATDARTPQKKKYFRGPSKKIKIKSLHLQLTTHFFVGGGEDGKGCVERRPKGEKLGVEMRLPRERERDRQSVSVCEL